MDEIKKYFGKNLKRIRQQKGFTQEKLSELLELNQRQLTRIETGKSFPSFATLDNICNALDIPAYTLFDFSEFYECAKTGTDDVIHLSARKTESNVIILKDKISRNEKHTENLDTFSQINNNELTEENFFNISKDINKSVSVEYYEDGKISKKVLYNPNGTSSVEIQTSQNEKLMLEIVDKIIKMKNSAKKLRYLKLAIKCLEDKSSVEKMQNVLEGLLLV